MTVTTSDGVRLWVEVHGRGTPVLLVHGFPLSGEMWSGTVARLGHRYRLIVPDLRGHGRSEASESASMARYAADLVEVLEAVGEEGPVVVVGLSMGGYVALEMLRRAPERVRALVLVDSRAQGDTEEGARLRHQTAERVLREGSAVVADGMVDRLFAPEASPEMRGRWRAVMAATAPAGAAAALRAMAARPDSFPTLASADLPVLVVVGEHDAITPPADARRMAETAPGARLAVVERAGHLTPVERPERFAALLEEFLAGVEAGPS